MMTVSRGWPARSHAGLIDRWRAGASATYQLHRLGRARQRRQRTVPKARGLPRCCLQKRYRPGALSISGVTDGQEPMPEKVILGKRQGRCRLGCGS